MPQMCMLLVETSSQEIQHLVLHRMWDLCGWRQRPDHLFYYYFLFYFLWQWRNRIFLRFSTSCQYPDHLSHMKPTECWVKEMKVILMHTYRSFFISFFRSLLSMIKGFSSWAGICSLHCTWYPMWTPSLSEPISYSSKSERIWVRDAITPNTSHGVLGPGRDPRVYRAQVLIQQIPGQKAAWRPAYCTLSLSNTSYFFQGFSTFAIYLFLQ